MSELSFVPIRRKNRDDGAGALLSIRQLTVKVGMRRVIANLDLELFEGDAVCIGGPNGSGKSTLLNAIAGTEPARIEAGTIAFAGRDITKLPPHERARQGLSFMRQRDNVFADLTVEENLRLAAGEDGLARFREQYLEWNLSLARDKRAGTLSGGQKQRLAWAMATLRPCRLLLADEPEAGMSENIRLPSATMLFVSHNFAEWKDAAQ